LININN